MPEAVTTIKVPKSVRERIAARANEQHITAAEVITQLLDEADRRARFDAVRAAYIARTRPTAPRQRPGTRWLTTVSIGDERSVLTLERGALVWVDVDPTAGREQRGTRPPSSCPAVTTCPAYAIW